MLSLTVPAGAVQFSEVLDTVVFDNHIATTVMLDDFVRGVLCSTSCDSGSPGALLDGNRILHTKLIEWNDPKTIESKSQRSPHKRLRTKLRFLLSTGHT